MEKSKKCQVLRKKCCNYIYAMCIEPECFIDRDWLKDVRKAVKDGDSIEMLDTSVARFGKCECELDLKS